MDLPARSTGIAKGKSTQSKDRASRQQFVAWLALSLAIAVGSVLFLALGLGVSADPLLLPLDDSYIHFNYARQLARGEPMVYSPNDPPTSGGTSLLYPVVLAAGIGLGFSGWALSYWALAIGAFAFGVSAWLVYVIGRDMPLDMVPTQNHGVALLLALAYSVSGPMVWAALSGMETALFLLAVLLTLRALQLRWLGMLLAASMITVTVRPEGVIVAGVSVLAWALIGSWPDHWPRRVRQVIWLGVPIGWAFVQPVLNYVTTGDMSSSGMQAKSHLANTSIPLTLRLQMIVESWGRIWRELLTGSSPEQGEYLPFLVVIMACLALAWYCVVGWQSRHRLGREMGAAIILPVATVACMVGLTAAVAMLDTAFWQFKRYQLPAMALMFPLAAWGAALFGRRASVQTGYSWVRWIIPGVILASSAANLIVFARYYRDNVVVVRDQQVAMADWVRDHLPENARIGAHDVGLLRYFGERALYDVVGLTTPGPAESWRQGPGAIYEHMASSAYRPDFFAIYPDVQGLRYLVDAGVMGEVLAEFPVMLPPNTVASASDYQAVYVADWSSTRAEEQVTQAATLAILEQVRDLRLVDQVDVANLDSEAEHHYAWWQDRRLPGFTTEVYRHEAHACGLSDGAMCWATDGGRLLTGGEAFTIQTQPGEDVVLVTRVHGRTSVPLIVTWGKGEQAITRIQPAIPGRWVEIVTILPGETIVSDDTTIRIIVDDRAGKTLEPYMPYYHWVYQGQFEAVAVPDEIPLASFGPNGAIRLLEATMTVLPEQLVVDLIWEAGGTVPLGDGVLFVHLYKGDNIYSEPAAQVVERPVQGVMPPQNWSLGAIEDQHNVPLKGLAAGRYRVALGFFDALSGERYDVVSDALGSDDRRLFVGDILIEEFAR